MHFIASKQDLLKAVGITSKATSRISRSILECILIEATEENISLRATDISLSIQTSMNGGVQQAGKIAVPGKYLLEIIGKMPESDITLKTVEENTVEISSENSHVHLQCMDADEFPSFPQNDSEKSVKIFQEELKKMLNQTMYAAAQTEETPILTGVCFTIEAGEMEIAAVDRFRMAVRTTNINYEGELKCVVPARTIREIARIAEADDQTVKFSVFGNMASFEVGQTQIITRLMEGDYINYRKIIPSAHQIEIIAGRDSLIESLDRASILAREVNDNLIKMKISGSVVEITSRTEVGDINESVYVRQNGTDIDIALNARFLMDALKAVDDEEVKLCFTTPLSPCLITAANKAGYKNVITPVCTQG